MNSLTLRFRPIDALFFRELRPQGGPGGMPLQSLFPPPPRTFSGTIHKLLHEATQTAFVPANQRGGEATRGLENLRLRGPWLGYAHSSMDDVGGVGGVGGVGAVDKPPVTRLYPWPAHILRTREGKSAPMWPSAVPIESDLGRIYLPHLAADLPERKSYRSPKDVWLAEDDFFKLLADPHYQVPRCYSAPGSDNNDHAMTPGDPLPLLVRETRLGIARNSASRSAADGQLYQTSHIRTVPELVFDVQLLASYSHKNGHSYTKGCIALEQLKAALGSGGIVRLGSEGHSAHISVVDNAMDNAADNTVEPPSFQPLPSNGPPPQQVTVAFTTHADFGENLQHDFAADWKPQKFTCKPDTTATTGTTSTTSTTWRGFPEGRSGVELEIVSAVCGKYIREGGWDSTLPGPRDARPLLPAGSIWFCRVLRGDARRLHGAQLGIGRELGRGQIAIGTWPTYSSKETAS